MADFDKYIRQSEPDRYIEGGITIDNLKQIAQERVWEKAGNGLLKI